MRKGEKARVMIKAAHGFGHQETAGAVEYPEGWGEGERKKQLQTRRTFYEIKLHSWIIRHDLLGEGSLTKTIVEPGVGYDRPTLYDEIFVDLKVYQKDNEGTETVFTEVTSSEHLMTDTEVVSPVVKRILQSMKRSERITTVVRADFVESTDPEFKIRHANFVPEEPLLVDV